LLLVAANLAQLFTVLTYPAIDIHFNYLRRQFLYGSPLDGSVTELQ